MCVHICRLCTGGIFGHFCKLCVCGCVCGLMVGELTSSVVGGTDSVCWLHSSLSVGGRETVTDIIEKEREKCGRDTGNLIMRVTWNNEPCWQANFYYKLLSLESWYSGWWWDTLKHYSYCSNIIYCHGHVASFKLMLTFLTFRIRFITFNLKELPIINSESYFFTLLLRQQYKLRNTFLIYSSSGEIRSPKYRIKSDW